MTLDSEPTAAVVRSWGSSCHYPGSFSPQTHLDELPQLVNILQGDMALIGPVPSGPRSPSGWNGSSPITGGDCWLVRA